MGEKSMFLLHLPQSIKIEVERLARAEGISMNQFVATAVAEKLVVMRSAELLPERRKRADFAALSRIMEHADGELPQPGDEIDSGLEK
jgi:hypothetical protein